MRSTLLSLPATRRYVVVVLGAMLIALALVVLASALAPKKADAATQIVNRTFSKSGQILIPDDANVASNCTIGPTSGLAAPYPSEKSVSGFPQGTKIRDVNLTLKNYTQHDFPDDVDVLLVHKGVNRTVMSDVGDHNDVSNITLVLDDEANFFLPDEGTLVGGSFKPRNVGSPDNFPSPAPTQNSASALFGFDNLDPNGVWRLFVQDDSGQDCGKFGGGWSIRIKAAVPI
jgi:hypothetical protein